MDMKNLELQILFKIFILLVKNNPLSYMINIPFCIQSKLSLLASNGFLMFFHKDGYEKIRIT